VSKQFRIVIECQTPEGSSDDHASAYASNVCDYVRDPLFVKGIGYVLGVTDVGYEFESTDEEMVEGALDYLRKSYRDDVEEAASSFVQQARDGEFESVEDLDQYINAYIEMCNRICEMRKMYECLMYSDRTNSYFNEHGEYTNLPATAYAAFKADIIEHMNGEGVFIDDPTTWKEKG